MITLSGQHFAEEAIIQSIHNALDLEQAKHIMAIANPALCKEGDQWCYIWGEMPALYIAGFGDTPIGAMWDFVNGFRTSKFSSVQNVQESGTTESAQGTTPGLPIKRGEEKGMEQESGQVDSSSSVVGDNKK
jgi:hypothetical protein